MPLDPQAKRYLEHVAALGLPPVEEQSPEDARRQSEASADALFGPKEEVRSIDDTVVEGVPVRVYTPDLTDVGPPPTLVYLHGGGWVVGSVNTHDGVCRALANRARCQVISVDYRLAPEHPFPAAVEDAWTVTRWALERAPRVAVAGDSAGGNLAAVAAMRARDAGLPLALQVLIYPVVDHAFDTRSYRDNGQGYGLTTAAMRHYWSCYLGDAEGSQPEASPLRAPSLAGVAPALVIVCEYDPLRDEGVAFAERLRAEGVEARLSEYRGMIHGFARLGAFIDRAGEVLDECAATARQALRPD
ncbi:MAG TPA: alpha/beta hydrolase [Candidatus Dormibacteraeota bacterium]|nr:alpha/beta hydrolase [Candidatus Dormibacteraeota bacterium]